MALAMHAELCRERDCPPEARLYYRNFALLDWWPCISSAFLPEEWQADISEREDVTGKATACWMRTLYKVNCLSLQAAHWGVRMREEAVQRKMKRMADKARITY